jgi:hypothetical protein
VKKGNTYRREDDSIPTDWSYTHRNCFDDFYSYSSSVE